MPDLFSDATPAAIDLKGAAVWQGLLDRASQEHIVADLRRVAEAAPFQRYETSRGRKLSVRMTSAGALGWISDRRGYRYVAQQPGGSEWPPIPASLLSVWARLVPEVRGPESCLVNYYGDGARMGLHQDKDESDFSCPVVSISLGDDGLFRIGGPERSDPTKSIWLRSGDVVVLSGGSRLAHHGVDRIRFRSSDLLPDGGRINLTLRVVG
jgi:alkylated DNA repair protein (DNA oxidative demethylase)